jgi:hypothetical protein
MPDGSSIASPTEYKIDYPNLSVYTKIDSSQFYLPPGFALDGGTLPTKAKRTGYAQKQEYVPLLDKYCKVYTKGEDTTTEYYGYEETQYISPTFVTNLVSNTEFKNTSGWVGTFTGADKTYKAEREVVFGRFINNKFVSSNDYLTNTTDYAKSISGTTTDEKLKNFLSECKAYLKVKFNG